MPEQFLAELFLKNNIVSVASSYMNFKKSGRNLVGLCPFHNEKTPSLFIYPESDSFYCFGCGVGGSVITFLEKAENLSYIDAVKLLAERSGMILPDHFASAPFSEQRGVIFSVNREAAKFYHSSLCSKENDFALWYLKNRGVLYSTIRYFGIGYSPTSRRSLCKFLLEKGYKATDIVKSGLASYDKRGEIIDRFFGRIMFPIIDAMGNVIAFGARAIQNQKPKYLNTSDTSVFKKGSNLFSINFAKKSKENFFILTEGYMDVVAIYQAGFNNAIATLGTSITYPQVYLLSKYTKEVVLAYDSDKAGLAATQRAILILRKGGVLVRVLKLSKGKDPDEFIRSFEPKQAAYKFSKLIKESKGDVEYRLEKIGLELDKTKLEDKLAYLKGAVKILCEINDAIEQEIWAGRISREMKIEKETLMRQLRKEKQKKYKIHKKKEIRSAQNVILARGDDVNPEKPKFLRAANAEEALISYLIYHPQKAAIISRKISFQDFSTSFNGKVFQFILQKLAKNMEISSNITINSFSEKFSHPEISRIVKFFIKDSFKNATFDDAIKYIHIILEEKRKNSIENDLQTSNTDSIMAYMKMLKFSRK
ncbi:MAG: DNA primase [Oscillospiraceae bacterium]|nr:DNA primase [Oscillospiraceae bacterium]